MASSMTSTVNGVKVVTHIIPIVEDMKSPDLKASLVEPEKLPPATRMFLKGRPMTLGLMQVFIGLVMILLLTIMIVTNNLYADFVFTLGVPFIISGIVAINAHYRLTTSLIEATLAVSIICALLAAAGIGYFSWELSFPPDDNDDECDIEGYWGYMYMRENSVVCVTISQFRGLLVGMKGLLLTLSCLEMCVCITLSVFSVRAICQEETDDDYGPRNCILKDGMIKELHT